MLDHLIAIAAGVFVGFVMSIPVGPVALIVFQRSMFKSRLLGLVTGAGASIADVFLASIGIFSLRIVWKFIHEHGLTLRLIGGIIVLILGLMTVFSKSNGGGRKKDTAISIFEHAISGFGLTVMNPIAAFTFFFVFGKIGNELGLHNPSASWSLIGGVLVGSFLWWLLLTHIAKVLGHKIKPDHIGVINKCFGLAIALIGAAMVLGAFW